MRGGGGEIENRLCSDFLERERRVRTPSSLVHKKIFKKVLPLRK
jgi:hypothetical protein